MFIYRKVTKCGKVTQVPIAAKVLISKEVSQVVQATLVALSLKNVVSHKALYRRKKLVVKWSYMQALIYFHNYNDRR